MTQEEINILVKENRELAARVERLRAALDAAIDVGIYPASFVGGDKPYKKRTDYMDGWNAAQFESLNKATEKLQPGDWDE